MDLANNFATDYFGYFFGQQTAANLFTLQPDAWGISIHEAANNPTGQTLDSTWYTDPLKRKTVAAIANWDPILGSYVNGVEIPAQIGMNDYVPNGDSWAIDHFIIWAFNAGTPYPVYTGTFSSTINLTGLQVLLIDTFTIT